MHWSRLGACCVAAVTLSALPACNSDEAELPAETLSQVATRLTEPGPSIAPPPAGNPSSYRIEFIHYTEGLTAKTKVVGAGRNRRRALKATRFVRDIVRPFDETGAVTRSLGFVREAAAADARVTFVRPIPDDPRPLVYPAEPDKHSRQIVIAGRDCHTTTVVDATYCIDAAGLVLMIQRENSLEIAAKVTTSDTVKAASELAASVAEGFRSRDRGSIRPIHPESAPPGTDWSLDRSPAGFEFVGRYAVAPLTAEVLKKSRKVTANIVDVYVRGPDAVVVERGGKLDLGAVDDADLGTLAEPHDVELGALGAGKVGIGGVGPFGYREVRAFPAKGKYVVVAGTLPEAELVEIARSLRSWPGTKISYLDKL